MVLSEQIPEYNGSIDMAVFRDLVAAERGRPGSHIELLKIDLMDLTAEDAKMWYGVGNYRRGLITRDEFEQYRRGVDQSKNVSREQFCAVIANTLNALWGREELEDEEEQSGGKR